jgi:hypothetical protein
MPSMTDVTWPADMPPGFHFLAKPGRSTCNIDHFFLSHSNLVGRRSQRDQIKLRSRNLASAGFSTGSSRQTQHKFNAKEGINHGYKATEYPDSLGR